MTDHGDRLDLQASVDSGTAELIADPGHDSGWTLVVNDVAQSYVNLADPTHLPMMYARLVAGIIDTCAPAGAPLRTLHLGGGGLAMPRYIAGTRPGSRQTVVEIDRGLIEFVRFGLPIPADAGITIEAADAAEAIIDQPADEFQLILSDIYRGGDTPVTVAGVDFARHADTALAPGGFFVLNVLDAAGLLGTRRAAATLRTVFDHMAVIATPQMLRARRDGNVIVIAAHRAPPVGQIMAAAHRHGAVARTLQGADLDSFVGSTAPITD